MNNNYNIEDSIKMEGDKKVIALITTGILSAVGTVVVFKNKDKIKNKVKGKLTNCKDKIKGLVKKKK